MTLNLSKTLLVLSASILLVATCAVLAKTATVRREGPIFRNCSPPYATSALLDNGGSRIDTGIVS